jgi:hypothetical protein
MGFKPERWGIQGEPVPPPPKAPPPLWFRIARFSTLTNAILLCTAVVGVIVGLKKATGGPWAVWLPSLAGFGLVLILGLSFAWARLLADRHKRRPRPPRNPFEK